MTHADEIRDIMRRHLPRGRWLELDVIYEAVSTYAELDDEDIAPAAPGHTDVRWRRHVRNVLQRMKRTPELKWDGKGKYLLV